MMPCTRLYVDYKLVCSNSDSNKKVIREQQRLGGDYGEHLAIGGNCEK